MAIFAFLHLAAYPYNDYILPRESPESYQGGWRAFIQVVNITDSVRAISRGWRWLFIGRHRREEDVSYQRFRQTIGVAMGGSSLDIDDSSTLKLGNSKTLEGAVRSGENGS